MLITCRIMHKNNLCKSRQVEIIVSCTNFRGETNTNTEKILILNRTLGYATQISL